MSVLHQNEIFASRYILAGKVGDGGFSEVWKAHDAMAEEALIAIKIYAPGKGLDDHGIRQFRKEYAITHKVSHPNLMKVSYFDIVDGSPYLIMPFCEQGSLGGYLQRQGPFNERQTATLMYQMGNALTELHRQQSPILHQDIKPDNILVYEADHFILTDFGISTQTKNTLRKATSSLKPLTIAYAPPERFAADPVETEAGDVFSLGVTLYEMCTGHLPWSGNGGVSLLKGAQVPHLPPSLPMELNKMLRACMAPEWQKRPTPAQITAWGKFYLDNEYWQFAPPPARRRTPLYAAAAGLGVVLVAGGAFLYSQSGPAPTPTRDAGRAEASVVPAHNAEPAKGNTPDDREPAAGESSEPVAPTPKPPKANDRTPPQAEPQKPKPPVKPPQKATATPVETHALEEYLNKLSDSSIPRKERKKLRNEVLSWFVEPLTPVYDNASSIDTYYSAEGLLNKLLDSPYPYRVTLRKVDKDAQGRITGLLLNTKIYTK